MAVDMPILDDRTDVLKEIVARPIKPADQITVIREMASVVISMSGDVFSLMRMVRGENGNDDGLLGEVRRIRADVTQVLHQLSEAKQDAAKAESDAKDAKQNSKFSAFVNWLTDKVLPSLLTAFILAVVAFMIAVYLHLKIVPAN